MGLIERNRVQGGAQMKTPNGTLMGDRLHRLQKSVTDLAADAIRSDVDGAYFSRFWIQLGKPDNAPVYHRNKERVLRDRLEVTFRPLAAGPSVNLSRVIHRPRLAPP